MSQQITDRPTIDLADLRLRPYAGEADIPAIVVIENAEDAADGIHARTTVDDVLNRYRNASESFDPVRDVTIAEIGGQTVAFGGRQWVDTTDGLREYRVDGAVLPAWRRRGIGRVLLANNERLVRELAAGHDTERPKFLG